MQADHFRLTFKNFLSLNLAVVDYSLIFKQGLIITLDASETLVTELCQTFSGQYQLLSNATAGRSQPTQDPCLVLRMETNVTQPVIYKHITSMVKQTHAGTDWEEPGRLTFISFQVRHFSSFFFNSFNSSSNCSFYP